LSEIRSSRERSETARPWLASRWDRLNGAGRVTGVDLARGLAVLGMFAAHLARIPVIDPADPETWIGIVHGRSSILFATLAGVSIGLMTGGTRPREGRQGREARLKIVVRAIVLFLLGVLLIATGVPVYVILPAYAVLFVLAIPFTGLNARALFATAAVIAVVMPFVQAWLGSADFWSTPVGNDLGLVLGWHYPFTVWIAFVLAGMGAARADLRRTRTQLWLLGGGGALAFVGYSLYAWTSPVPPAIAAPGAEPSFWEEVWTAADHSTGLLEVIGSGGFALAVLGACLLVCRTGVRWVVLPLRAVGAMPLSAYTAQLVVWWLVAEAVLGDAGDLTGFRNLDPLGPFVLWTIVGCTAWALLIGRGPLEWLLDRISHVVVAAERDRPADRLNG
jgi:uncharacterized membrane protein YeiB